MASEGYGTERWSSSEPCARTFGNRQSCDTMEETCMSSPNRDANGVGQGVADSSFPSGNKDLEDFE